ncbi:MAG: tetratricopeptide repeat protein [Deltaproteobacteria bacterium]|nr:tetratricopeptide repeat protein [Deltaproteobacteria bacterium]
MLSFAFIITIAALSQTATTVAIPSTTESSKLNIIAAAKQARKAFDEGITAKNAGDFSKAEKLFSVVVNLIPSWALAHLELGIALISKNPKDPRAIAAFEQAVNLDSNNARAHFELGSAYQQQNRLDDAVRELLLALEKRTNQIDTMILLASVYSQNNNSDKAIEIYHQILQNKPGHVGALAAMSVCYENLGKLDRAEAALVTIARLHPSVLYHRYRLAEFYERIGEYDKADKIYYELELIDPRQRKMRKLPKARR